ncbi:MAG: crossover junction endodeoxyribonuclease RuvC, partial [Chloroflexi bacterium]|nr:crossover junction endodeoxyribonuclease RuvC [Chloroflexota bacterium]
SVTGKVTLTAMGVMRAPRNAPLTIRLLHIRDQLAELLDQIAPDEVAVEEPYFARNVRSAFSLGEARAIALLTAADRGLPIFEYPPTAVRQTVAGHGGATKMDVAAMVALHVALPIGTTLPHDATDATAVALCHVYRRRQQTN